MNRILWHLPVGIIVSVAIHWQFAAFLLKQDEQTAAQPQMETFPIYKELNEDDEVEPNFIFQAAQNRFPVVNEGKF